ncbi:Lysophospholipid acyltransferase [Cladophialophora chaetospira]|uniref:Lysophospholipid acyltransferase n=1 Tax=Cladophialophora chaetospira TaxID=386627 RepID=A0AA39CIA4_9EURO|nr:Lysophospholipid acyltransferase [Cladophialophora chaetospira]
MSDRVRAFLWLSNVVGGASVGELKLLFVFLSSYPLSAWLKRLPDNKPHYKSIFSVAICLFYLVGLFDLWSGFVTLFIDAAVTYALIYYVDGSLMPWLVFMQVKFLMGHMAVNHIERQRTNDPSLVDITGGQMVLIMKLHALAWNYHDGHMKPELLTDSQKERAVYKLPEFIDYAGYVFFFPSIFTGPAFDYVDYKRWLDGSIYTMAPETPTKSPTAVKTTSKTKKTTVPHSAIPATRKAIGGLLWIGLFMQFSTWYNVPLILSDDFLTFSFPHRVWILQLLGFTSRMKYYGVWSLTEGACIMAGISYNGIDDKGHAKWDHLENVYPPGIELAQNSRAYLDNWNKNTNKWLRNYIYLRVTPAGKKPGFRATLATFLTSAFWHGFYPGYYLSFLLAAFIQTVAKNFRRYFRPFVMSADGKQGTKYKIYYDVLGYVATQLAFCFTTAPFVILGWNDSLTCWARVYFYAVIGVAASTAFFASPAKKMLIKKLDARSHPRVRKTLAEETQHPPSLGLPDDPGREIDDALDEIRAEIETRQRRGSAVTMPTGDGLKRAIEQKMGKKLEMPAWKVPQVFASDKVLLQRGQARDELESAAARGATEAKKVK